MKKLELSIPGMQSAHCQETVNNAIKTINGIEVQHMEAGKLSVSIDSAEIKELVNAIEKAGYEVSSYDSQNFRAIESDDYAS
ncbi:heavy-metal-associated domain-containing protein [Elizabethkingia anophelis]|nr:heavy-metal-associated domain-containing protein [Elizabethkingia anophelis]MCT4209370.1 heavy-metal-associated domain-containing protein [Elizabethkingia anophelis]